MCDYCRRPLDKGTLFFDDDHCKVFCSDGCLKEFQDEAFGDDCLFE